MPASTAAARFYYAVTGAGRAFQVVRVDLDRAGRMTQAPAEGVTPKRTQREAEEVMDRLNRPIFARLAALANYRALEEGYR